VGIIGCGKIARSHALGYKSIPRVNIVAGSDINPESGRSFSEEFNVKHMYRDYRDMLQKENLDLVSVCTWPRSHCEITVFAAENGVKGILCEKPLAVNLEEADRMISICNKNGVTLATAHHHRFDPQSVMAKDLLDKGEIGQPLLFWGHCRWDLMNNGSHVIDLIDFFNNDESVEWVIGQIDRRKKRFGFANHPDMPVEDMALGYAKYKNGLKATIEVGEFAPPDFQFHLIGTEGFIDVNVPGGPALRMFSRNGPKTLISGPVDLPYLLKVGDDSRRKEILELISALEENREHLSSGRKGRAALEVIIAIFESSFRREVIEFPVEVFDFPLERMIKKSLV
jgi:UDP-N-acetyl-2-amino-2-deoxyglucuronate dehydrogenase